MLTLVFLNLQGKSLLCLLFIFSSCSYIRKRPRMLSRSTLLWASSVVRGAGPREGRRWAGGRSPAALLTRTVRGRQEAPLKQANAHLLGAV